MGVELLAVVFDSESPPELARFWETALRWEVRNSAADAVELAPSDPSDPTTFRLEFRKGAETKTGKNPIHFDLTSGSIQDQRSSVEELIAIGARHADVGQRGDEGHVVLADPEGNEFCVIEPGNSFLASCPRLGAVNCDGTKELGYFFGALFGWPLVWDQDEETAIQAPTGNGPKITWSGPPLMAKSPRERIHFHVAPAAGSSTDEAIAELLRLGASHGENRGHRCTGTTSLVDVDGNELCVVTGSSMVSVSGVGSRPPAPGPRSPGRR